MLVKDRTRPTADRDRAMRNARIEWHSLTQTVSSPDFRLTPEWVNALLAAMRTMEDLDVPVDPMTAGLLNAMERDQSEKASPKPEKERRLPQTVASPEYLVGPLVRKTRLQVGLTLDELAEKTGVSKPYLSMIENDKGGIPSEETLSKLEIAMGMHAGRLVRMGMLARTPTPVLALIPAAVIKQFLAGQSEGEEAEKSVA